jgi:alginate O-acetyltransferase complex protein AlgI
MIFDEATYYLLFLFPSVALFHLAAYRLSRHAAEQVRPWILCTFGVGFFVYFGYVHFGGWKGSAAVGLFVLELATSRLYAPGSRWCIFGIVQAVLILCVFKYIGFFSQVWHDLAGDPAGHLLTVHLPLGISFFTFEFIHFAVDTYRGQIPRRSLRDYAAFIFFFPSMVAGPIKRYSEFEPELREARFEPELFARGTTRILAGLAKKHLLADTFTLWSDQLASDALWSAPRLAVASWLLAYGMKIYFDFSGYSDIAIGSGYLFGIRLPENFDWPYASASISEFWRRWHISLGRWIFDYIYKPLGGSRRGEGRTAMNLLAAFAVSGLWHGAAYNFVVWGLWHGLMLVIHRRWQAWPDRPTGPVWRATSIVITFFAVNFGWAFFCVDLRRGMYALGRIAGVV